MVVSVVVGVALVNLWVEEPVYIKENLYFDYTDVHPYAILDLGFDAPGKTVKNIPVGHFCNVRLTFVMPESDYNREIGNFQASTIDNTSVAIKISIPDSNLFCFFDP